MKDKPNRDSPNLAHVVVNHSEKALRSRTFRVVLDPPIVSLQEA